MVGGEQEMGEKRRTEEPGWRVGKRYGENKGMWWVRWLRGQRKPKIWPAVKRKEWV